jgi:hypothetical protein
MCPEAWGILLQERNLHLMVPWVTGFSSYDQVDWWFSLKLVLTSFEWSGADMAFAITITKTVSNFGKP